MDRFDEMRSKVLTVQEVSTYLRVHPSTIYRMLKKNQLPAFRVGSDWRFTVEAIDKWRRFGRDRPARPGKRERVSQ